MNTAPTWQQDTSDKTDSWRKEVRQDTRCYALQCEGATSYCWQVYRDNFYQGGIIADRDAAMAKADEMLAMPIDEYNALVAIGLKNEMRKLERDLLRLQPNVEILRGYYLGYEAGVADTKRKAEAVLS